MNVWDQMMDTYCHRDVQPAAAWDEFSIYNTDNEEKQDASSNASTNMQTAEIKNETIAEAPKATETTVNTVKIKKAVQMVESDFMPLTNAAAAESKYVVEIPEDKLANVKTVSFNTDNKDMLVKKDNKADNNNAAANPVKKHPGRPKKNK